MARGFTELDGHDAYDLLGLADDATVEQIRAAHRKLVRASHPDLNRQDRSAAALTGRLNAARDILLDRREAYDEFRRGPAEEQDEEEEIIEDPWSDAAPGSGHDDPWSGAATGPAPHRSTAAGYAPPPQYAEPQYAQPPYTPPFQYAPHRPPPTVYPAPQQIPRHRPNWALLGCGCSTIAIFLVGLAVLIAVAGRDGGSGAPRPRVEVPSAFAGDWTGSGRPTDGGGRMKIGVEIESGWRTGTTRYSCGGVLIALAATEKSVTFAEHVTTQGCDSAFVRLTLRDDKRLDIVFCHERTCRSPHWKGILARA